jgi:hypothetical protein
MDALTQLREEIRRGSNPLLGPKPLLHSQELGESLPLVRRHVGPRLWYQCLEASQSQPGDREPT